jgi:hypothetical protein
MNIRGDAYGFEGLTAYRAGKPSSVRSTFSAGTTPVPDPDANALCLVI